MVDNFKEAFATLVPEGEGQLIFDVEPDKLGSGNGATPSSSSEDALRGSSSSSRNGGSGSGQKNRRKRQIQSNQPVI